MTTRILMSGNEAAARGALDAGCKALFAYPITPQTEIMEHMAKELPKVGGVYLQVEGEYAAIYMTYAASLTGERVMTASSGCGLALMSEGISYCHAADAPLVIVDVSRLGPGIGTGGQHGQSDYRMVVHGGGNGGYHSIVLAPADCQETYDTVQLAFYLADKYRIVVMVLTDFMIARSEELVETRRLEFGPLPAKDWALKGKANKGGRFDVHRGGQTWATTVDYFTEHQELYRKIEASEIRFETYKTEEADFLLTAYGSMANVCHRAVDLAREQGLKVGLFRPISLWPFPVTELRALARKSGKVLVVEDCEGQYVDDVRCAVEGQVPVHLLGIWGRHNKTAWGVIHPERVLEEVTSLYGK